MSKQRIEFEHDQITVTAEVSLSAHKAKVKFPTAPGLEFTIDLQDQSTVKVLLPSDKRSKPTLICESEVMPVVLRAIHAAMHQAWLLPKEAGKAGASTDDGTKTMGEGAQ